LNDKPLGLTMKIASVICITSLLMSYLH